MHREGSCNNVTCTVLRLDLVLGVRVLPLFQIAVLPSPLSGHKMFSRGGCVCVCVGECFETHPIAKGTLSVPPSLHTQPQLLERGW